MKTITKTTTCFLIFGWLGLASMALADESGDRVIDRDPGTDHRMAVSATTVLGAIRALGSDAQSHLDVDGEPHLVFTDSVGGANDVAVFMDDCGPAGCEDVTLFAAFSPNEAVTDAVLNQWNHVSSRVRSKAARSDNGDITLSMPMSFYSDDDHRQLSMLIGLFLVEVNFMTATMNESS